jgi:hypothetical protein
MADLLVVSRDRISIVSQAGKQGLPGPPGKQGNPGPPGGTTLEYIAGTAIGGHRAVILGTDGKLAYASAAEIAHAGRVIGITVAAADENESCQVQTFERLEEPSWNWDVNLPVYLAADGLLTQVAPSSPASKFSLVLGFPISSTALFLNIREPIVLL